MKIAFDIGGVISKYPKQFLSLIYSLNKDHEIFIITDMHDKNKIKQQLRDNGFDFINFDNVYTADYTNYGELCKAVLLKELKIDMFFDDFVGYVQWDSKFGPAPIRFLLQPDPFQPYWNDTWLCDDSSDFGRRRYHE